MCNKPGCNQSENIEKPVVEHHVSKPISSDTYIQCEEHLKQGHIKKSEKG